MWEKEKLLVTSNFSFSRSVFRRLVLQGLLGKGLNIQHKQVVGISISLLIALEFHSRLFEKRVQLL